MKIDNDLVNQWCLERDTPVREEFQDALIDFGKWLKSKIEDDPRSDALEEKTT